MSGAGAVKVATQGTALVIGMIMEGANASRETRKVREQVTCLRERLADAERAARDAWRDSAVSSSDALRGLEEAMANARGYLKKYDEAGIYTRSRHREQMATSLMYLEAFLNLRLRKLEMEATRRPRRGILKAASAGPTVGAPPPLVRRMPYSPVRRGTSGRQFPAGDPGGHNALALMQQRSLADIQQQASTRMPPMPSPSPRFLQPPVSPRVYTPAPSLYPPGPAVYPPGQPMYPTGRPMYFAGQDVYPNGQAFYPNEGSFYPDGQTFYSNGSSLYPDGQVLYPDTPQAVQPSRRHTPHPMSGPSRYPNGQAYFAGRPRFFPDGHNFHTSAGGYYLTW